MRTLPWFLMASSRGEMAHRAAERWRESGARVALLWSGAGEAPDADVVVRASTGSFPRAVAWTQAMATLSRLVMERGGAVMVLGHDAVDPDPWVPSPRAAESFLGRFADGCGVMQPRGELWDGDRLTCASPWVGRGWCERNYAEHSEGPTPLCLAYRGRFADVELHDVAQRAGVLWERWDMTQSRRFAPGERLGDGRVVGETAEEDAADLATLITRRSADYPGAILGTGATSREGWIGPVRVNRDLASMMDEQRDGSAQPGIVKACTARALEEIRTVLPRGAPVVVAAQAWALRWIGEVIERTADVAAVSLLEPWAGRCGGACGKPAVRMNDVARCGAAGVVVVAGQGIASWQAELISTAPQPLVVRHALELSDSEHQALLRDVVNRAAEGRRVALAGPSAMLERVMAAVDDRVDVVLSDAPAGSMIAGKRVVSAESLLQGIDRDAGVSAVVMVVEPTSEPALMAKAAGLEARLMQVGVRLVGLHTTRGVLQDQSRQTSREEVRA